MNRIASIAAAPLRLGAGFLAQAGDAVAIGASMLFTRARSWGLLLARTRIDYRTEVGDPATNSIVGAVVGWIARNFPTAPVRIVREDDPDGSPIVRSTTGPGYMLRLLEKPNPSYSGVLQWQATIVDFCMGNAYWLKVRNRSGRVVELWWAPASLLEPRWPEDDPSVFIGWYEYTIDGVPYKVRPEDVVHFRNGIDPHNPRKGLSQLGSLFREIFTDDEASNFTASLLRNLGVPGVILAPANTTNAAGTRADPETVKTKFQETFTGDNRGSVMVMTAPTEAKVLSWSPEQMNLRELRRIPEERTSAVLGVPAGVVGLGAGLDRNTFTNYREAKAAAIEEGVGSLHRLIGAELEAQLLPEFVDTDRVPYDVFFDISVIPAMQEAADAVWKRHESAAAKGLITRADFKRGVGKKPAQDGSDDVYLVANNIRVLPIDEAGGAESPRLAIVPGEDEATAATAGVEPGPAGEVRCEGTRKNGQRCGALLAESATPPYRFRCPKPDCRAVTSSENAA